jgi:aspartyl-tRNA synthetase
MSRVFSWSASSFRLFSAPSTKTENSARAIGADIPDKRNSMSMQSLVGELNASQKSVNEVCTARMSVFKSTGAAESARAARQALRNLSEAASVCSAHILSNTASPARSARTAAHDSENNTATLTNDNAADNKAATEIIFLNFITIVSFILRCLLR